jgi:hypothetical protein
MQLSPRFFSDNAFALHSLSERESHFPRVTGNSAEQADFILHAISLTVPLRNFADGAPLCGL